jgi:hypothetical protein
MTNRLMLAAVVAGAAFATAGAQTASANGQVESSAAASGAATSAAARARERAITDRYLRTVQTEVMGKVDTRSAKAGQEVSARVLDDAELADGTKLPKGSKLVGRVVQVQAQDNQHAAALVLLFDQAEVKGGQTVPVRSVIEMVAPIGGVGKMSPMPMGGGGGYSEPSVGIADSSNAGVGSNGGVLGNVGRGVGGMGRGTAQPPLGGGGIDQSGAGGAAGPMGGQVGANGTGQVGGIGTGQAGGIGTGQVGIDGNTGIDAAGPIGSRPIDNVGMGAPIRDAGVRPVVSAGENVSGGARPTALPGVVLSQSTATGGSGMLVSMGRNITLDSGTRITMGVIRR